MQAAIDTGVVLPSNLLRTGTNKKVGEKPVMREVWLDSRSTGVAEEPLEWRQITPASATILRRSRTSIDGDDDRPVVLTRQLASDYFGLDMRSGPEMFRDFWRNTEANRRVMVNTLVTPFRRSRPPAAATSDNGGAPSPGEAAGPGRSRSTAVSQSGSRSPGGAGASTPTAEVTEPQRLAVGVVIAMPSRDRPHHHPHHPSSGGDHATSGDSESIQLSSSSISRGKMKATDPGSYELDSGELPHIALGVWEVDWKGSSVALKPPATKGAGK